MKIQVNKEDLIQGIQTVQNIVTPRATLPILSNLLLETQKERLKLTATDLDIGISTSIPLVNSTEKGAITLPAKKFWEIVRDFPQQLITLTVQKNYNIVIESNFCRFSILGLPPAEFPKLPEFRNKQTIRLNQVDLKEMLNLTMFAVSQDETRYVLNGILWELRKNKLRLVATDGRRLALSEKKLPEPGSQVELNLIIPSKAIHELNRNLNSDGSVILVWDNKQVLFEFGSIKIISRLIEGEFPDYQQVIPASLEKRIKIDREAFLGAIKRGSILVTPDYHYIKLEIFKNKMVVSKSTPDMGESREELDIDYQGEEIAIAFNPQYLQDVLKNLPPYIEKIDFELEHPEKPGVIRLAGYTYLVLPIKLG